jgi:hypothetical protein
MLIFEIHFTTIRFVSIGDSHDFVKLYIVSVVAAILILNT